MARNATPVPSCIATELSVFRVMGRQTRRRRVGSTTVVTPDVFYKTFIGPRPLAPLSAFGGKAYITIALGFACKRCLFVCVNSPQ